MKRVVKSKSLGKKSGWYTFGQCVLWILTALSIVFLAAACFGGNFNPGDYPLFSIMELAMPLWLIFFVFITVLDALWCRKAFVFCILAFIACANSIWNYCPLNLFGPSASKYSSYPKFTLMTYNVASFSNPNNKFPGNINPTVSHIIRTNADIVCLQETEVNLSGPSSIYHISSEQIDTIKSLYPYQLLYGGFLTVLSKYPIEAIHTPPLSDDQRHKWNIYPIGVFRLNIEGLPVTLFNIHLQSYGLNPDDKALYKNIADFKEIAEVAEGEAKESLLDIKNRLYLKIKAAAVKRAEQADVLCKYIEKFGGPNVIVAGDFNDVPGCYTLQRLSDCKMKEVYPQIGFGPMITFNADMFYFRIDHILYRGAMVPLNISKGHYKSSDHYPLVATFAITELQHSSDSNKN